MALRTAGEGSFLGEGDQIRQLKKESSLGVGNNHPQEYVSAPHLKSINVNNAYNHFTMSPSRALKEQNGPVEGVLHGF